MCEFGCAQLYGRFIIFMGLMILGCFSVAGQVTFPSKDSTQTGRIQLRPSQLETKYSYDSIIDKYILTETLDDINVSDPIILTPEEYNRRRLKKQRGVYFKSKFDAVNNRKIEPGDQQNNLLPSFYVNNNFFQSIFGGGDIEIIPQGSAQVDLGGIFNKQDNPALSPRNRSNFTFDFDQNINLSLKGHIGERLSINANYDTGALFDFQNQVRLDYTPDEDGIVRKIEVGNVSMPLHSSLIQGAESLFGVKAELQFGKTTVTGIYSQQNSERRQMRIEGGGALQEFDKLALEYDENRHFFLAHYFRDNYDEALEHYPYISSNIQITRIQVWVTNRSRSPEYLTNTRNIVGIQDLGEANPKNIGVLLDSEGNPVNSMEFSGFLNVDKNAFPNNKNNDFNPEGINGSQPSALTSAIRDMSSVGQGFGALSSSLDEGKDYAKLENARQLDPAEYTLHPQLGYISLNTRIRNDEVLAVTFAYTMNGKTYQVGEFGSDGIEASAPAEINRDNPEEPVIARNKSLVVKLLKSPITNVNEPVWDLMMKNIYDLGANQLTQEDFEFNILYSDPQPLNYITPAKGAVLPEDVENESLLRVFNLDNLNFNQDPVASGDGFFDYVPEITINPERGQLIFTTVEPFGEYLFEKLQAQNDGNADYNDPETYNANQEKYVFRSLYKNTKIQADQIESDKNKFQLTGSYKSSGNEGIPIGAYNVPRGSVRVTTGGRELQEGVDYTVNYELGRVKIINEALKVSDAAINVSTEDNALFGQKSKQFAGIHIEHEVNEHLQIGGTFLNLNEKPQTHKSNYGYEPMNNSMYGLNFNYSTEVPFFTRLVNKLPNVDTDVQSHLSVRGEFAYLSPSSPKGDDFDGETTSYIDDFESSQTSISVLSPQSWFLSSAPIGFGGEKANNDLASGYRRAKLNWYTIDPIFYSGRRPSELMNDDISQYSTRRIFKEEIFPDTDILEGDTQAIYSLDLAYYPKERGMYNYNPTAAGTNNLPNSKENFGGIMRGIETSDFEKTNMQYIEFWMIDPYIYEENSNLSKGTITFNLGSISEDVLKDGRKQYENGLPRDGAIGGTIETNFGKVPSSQSMVYTFDTEGDERKNQDLGLDGMSNEEEATKFPDFSGLKDPSNDDYEYYLNGEGGIVERYRGYNGLEGNSPSKVGQKDRGNTSEPSTEDVNNDNTMNTVNSYFEYKVPIYPGMSIDNNTSSVSGVDRDYITDVRKTKVSLKNGKEQKERWVKYRVPLNTSKKYAVGGISDLRSIRFMRMFLTDFNNSVVLRFGTMDLVRGEYREYEQALEPYGTHPEHTSGTSFSSETVSEETTSDYVTPPGVYREEFVSQNQTIREDEQSLALKVKNLRPKDMRAVYKNLQVDMRQYENLKMFLHAASLSTPYPKLERDELSAFIRIGTDLKNNFYQIEIPLKVSQESSSDPQMVWPEENDLDLPLSVLEKIKSTVIANNAFDINELNSFDFEGNAISGEAKVEAMQVGIKGNPSFGDVRVIMLGIKNNGDTDVSGEIWFNEFRMANMKNSGGWAVNLSMDTNLADLMSISANGHKSTAGFGSIEQGPNARNREDVEGYEVITNFNAGHLLPEKWRVTAPLSYSRAEELVTPQYDPEYKDLELKTLLDNTDDPSRRRELRYRAEEYTKRQSISIIGLSKQRTSGRTPLPIAVENFTFSGVYNQIDHRDFKIEKSKSQTVDIGATYDYSFDQVKLQPLRKIAALDSSEYYKPLRDFNISPLPNSISANGNFLRQYHEQKFRKTNVPSGNIGLPKLYQRDYRFKWGFTINDKLTESLDFVYSTVNNRIVKNYMNEHNRQDKSVGVWNRFFDMGDPNQHNQSLQINYNLPFNKFPFLTFIDAQYSFTSNFQWQKGSEILKDLPDIPDLGNTVQNSRTHQLNGTLRMKRLYDYLGLRKKGHQQRQVQERENRLGFTRSGEQNSKYNGDFQTLSLGDKLVNTGIDILTAINRISINYDDTQGTYLPGYLQSVGFMGSLKPSTGFAFGSQSNIREMAARKGWLTLYQDFNEQYSTNQTKILSFQADIDLLKGLTLDLDAHRTYSENYAENFQVNPETRHYTPLSSHSYGNFNISTIIIGTAFQNSDESRSVTFQKFRKNRLTIANRIAERAGVDLNDPENINQNTGYPKGFGRTSQQVLLPAFLAAYTGKSVNSIGLKSFRDMPLPNWNLKYTGLMNFEFFKSTFRRFSIQHGYDAGYTINQFQTNLRYSHENPLGKENRNQNGNFRSKTLISNINLTEQFSPLVKLDMEFKSAISFMAEVIKDRALSLSFDNNLLTEIRGDEYRLGLGYRIKDLKITTNIEGTQRMLSSDLNLKVDVSYRQNKTIARYLDTNDSRITTGQDRWEFHFTADYALTRHLTAMFYYDHNFSKYFVSSAFPQTTIRSGIRLRYSFGN